MAKRVVAMIAVCIFMIICGVPQESEAQSNAPGTNAAGAVLMEASTKKVLYEKNAHDKMPMASTTKIMTALVAIENGDLDSTVTVSKNASGVEGSSIWLGVGEKMTLKELLYGLMLASGNDAAVAIAEHVGGSVEWFIEMMNNKAKEIGANDTHFVTPNGLHDDNHYTTAYDLALISCVAMENPQFQEIVNTQYKELPWEGHDYNRVVKNKNKILWQYEGGNGVKTGYTKKAGRCLSAAAKRDGIQLVAVVLNDYDMFADCMSLLDYGFDNYQNYDIIEKGQYLGKTAVKDGMIGSIDSKAPDSLSLPLSEEEYAQIQTEIHVEEQVEAPVKQGDVLGSITVRLGDEVIYQTDVLSQVDVEKNTFAYHFDNVLRDWLKLGKKTA